jgi:hypothetical protein
MQPLQIYVARKFIHWLDRLYANFRDEKVDSARRRWGGVKWATVGGRASHHVGPALEGHALFRTQKGRQFFWRKKFIDLSLKSKKKIASF